MWFHRSDGRQHNSTDNHGYDAEVFEHKAYMKIFLQNYNKYKALWSECKHMTADDLYMVSTRWIETIIEMNSRAGQFQFLNDQIQTKKAKLEELEEELEFYKQVRILCSFKQANISFRKVH